MTPPEYPRPLSEAERRILEALLSAGGEKTEAFLAQVPSTSAIGACACGCVTRDLAVDRARVHPVLGTESPLPIEAMFEGDGGAQGGGIIIFVKDGYLASVEAYSFDAPILAWPENDRLRFYMTGAGPLPEIGPP